MLELDRVGKTYRVGTFGGKQLQAVRDVSFSIEPGEVVSLIGESGSGKSTIGRMILRLTPITSGSIAFEGQDITSFGSGTLKAYYRKVQGVFQDPFSSCNPIFKVDRVFDTIRSAFFPRVAKSDWEGRVEASLQSVSLDPGQCLHKYPHQLSGGQLQRLLIARALLLDIRFLVADEVISMLDASTRIDVLNLLGDLQSRGLAILFITHDLSLGNYISEQALILFRGTIVEMGRTDAVFGNPLHPYTRMLLSSVPQLRRSWAEVEAEVAAHAGTAERSCLYHDAYPANGRESVPGERAQRPGMVEAEDGHLVACFASGYDRACSGAAKEVPR
jgi:peptide/nickel transport system ATP-binding protein